MFLSQRATQAEYFDAVDRSFAEVADGYRQLARANRGFFRILLNLYCHVCWARSVPGLFPCWIWARATDHWELDWHVGRRGKGGIGALPTWTLTRTLYV